MNYAQRLERLRLDGGGDNIEAVVSLPQKREWFATLPGERLSIHVRGGDTGGRYSLLESVVEPDSGTPMHYHRENEIFHIVEGVLTFACGGKTFDAHPGTTVAIPAGAHHAWKNRTGKPVRTLVTIVPGGLEALFMQIEGMQPDEITALAAKFGSYIVGPPIAG